MSRMATRLRTPWYPPVSIASQTEPSAASESPISTQTRPGRASTRMARAIPRPIGSPWPSEPVATSTHGISGTGAGWPWSGLRNFRNDSNSSSVMAPMAFSTAYMRGDAWPLDRTNRSLARCFGSSTS